MDVFIWRANVAAQQSERFKSEVRKADRLAKGAPTTGPLTDWEASDLLRGRNVHSSVDRYVRKCEAIAQWILHDKGAFGVVHELVRKRAGGYDGYDLPLPPLATAPPAPADAVASTQAAGITGASWKSDAAMRQAGARYWHAIARDYAEAFESAMASLRATARTAAPKRTNTVRALYSLVGSCAPSGYRMLDGAALGLRWEAQAAASSVATNPEEEYRRCLRILEKRERQVRTDVQPRDSARFVNLMRSGL
jgi:hypothetical protein